MKKTRIIVPALAMIALSTAASIVGSVAWFTASRTATISAGDFAVVKTSANLDCTLTAGVGTFLDETDSSGRTLTLSHDISETSTPNVVTNVLTDGSFDHIAGNIYTPNAEGDGLDETNGTVAVGSASTSNMKRGELDGGDIYTAVTFNLTFKMSFGALEGDYGLYLDNTETNDVGASRFVCDDTDVVTAKGFRMAFYGATPSSTDYPGSSVHNTVFADLQESGKCTYVNSAATFEDGVAYNQPVSEQPVYDLIHSTYKTALPTSSTERSAALARPDLLGVFGYKSGSEVTLSFKVVCWFEGTDENIVNQDDEGYYNTVSSVLKFEAVQLKAAA